MKDMPDIDKEKSCCFFGHRKIDETEELKNNLCGIIENLITNEKVDTFLFGSKSEFDSLCLKTATELKEKYPHIKRIYVRSAYQYIPDWYEDSLLKYYEDTYFPEHMENAGKASKESKSLEAHSFLFNYRNNLCDEFAFIFMLWRSFKINITECTCQRQIIFFCIGKKSFSCFGNFLISTMVEK